VLSSFVTCRGLHDGGATDLRRARLQTSARLLASAGIVGVALGFGAQSLVKGPDRRTVHAARGPVRGSRQRSTWGEAIGVVETVGLRITTIRDMARRALVHPQRRDRPGRQTRARAGALVVIDIPIGFINAGGGESGVLKTAAEAVRPRRPTTIERVHRAAGRRRRGAADRGRRGQSGPSAEDHLGRPADRSAGVAPRA